MPQTTATNGNITGIGYVSSWFISVIHKQNKALNRLTLIGIIVAGIGNIIGLLLIHRGNAKEATVKNENLLSQLQTQESQITLLDRTNKTLETKIDGLNEQASNQKEELTKLRNDNKKLTSKLVKAQSEIISKFVGDDNYGMIGVSGVLCGNQFCHQLNFQNISKEPIYDVQVRYYNVEESEATMKNGMATIETLNAYVTKNIGNVTPSLSTPISEPKTFAKGGEHYIFYIGARNGIYYQESFLYPAENGMVATIDRIMKYNTKKEKYEELRAPYHHPDDFPINKEDVNWKLNFEE